MARTHGRIQHRIWSDPAFIALPEASQRLYMLALTQPGLSYAGVVPFTVRRWATLSGDSAVSKLRKAAGTLVRSDFVVIDHDTEELMIRSFLRHDGILDNPNVATAAADAWRSVHSPLLRTVFQLELLRLYGETPLPGRAETWDPKRSRLLTVLEEALPEPLPQGVPQALRVALGEGVPQGVDVRARGPVPAPAPVPLPEKEAS